MFNFQSLTAIIGKEDNEDNEDADRYIEHLNGHDSGQGSHPVITEKPVLEDSLDTLRSDENETIHRNLENGEARQGMLLEPQRTTPEVMITPDTLATLNHGEDRRKQLGAEWSEGLMREITQ